MAKADLKEGGRNFQSKFLPPPYHAQTIKTRDKALLAHCLISSLDATQNENVDTAWAELSEKRHTELISGLVKAVSWETIKNSVRR